MKALVEDAALAESRAFNEDLRLRLAQMPPVHTLPPEVVRQGRRDGKSVFPPLEFVAQARDMTIPTRNVPESAKNHFARTILRDILVLQAPLTSEVSERLNADSEDKFVMLALTDAQSQKMFWIMKNGDWSLELRPTKDPADSPESAEKEFTLLTDGMSPAQLRAIAAAARAVAKNER